MTSETHPLPPKIKPDPDEIRGKQLPLNVLTVGRKKRKSSLLSTRVAEAGNGGPGMGVGWGGRLPAHSKEGIPRAFSFNSSTEIYLEEDTTRWPE